MTIDAETFSLLRDAVARFVSERLIPREREIANLDQPPRDLLDEVRDIGLFGLTYPQEYGGLGLDALQEVQIGFELGRASPAMRNFISIHNGVAGQCLRHAGTPNQKARYMSRLASGEIIAAFALTEPDVGSDAKAVKTVAKRSGDGWKITGAKRFISNAPFAGLFTVFARTTDEAGNTALSAFLVEPGTKGMTVGKSERKMGQHGAPICDLVFDECYVESDAILGGKPGVGLDAAMKGLDRGRLFIAACCVGLAYRLIEDATDYANGRQQFGVPISRHQLVQAMLADSLTETFAARGMVESAARKALEGERITCEASMCKLFATEMVGRVADRAVQVHGGNGYIADYMVEQLYRDVRVLRIYEGTSQIQQIIIAKDLTTRRAKGERLS
ncbi:acyl-CoA dehydrogenase family protein [Bradyrhizobium sp. AUGA SZCCT0240]|uniref:acyl-CoA dehydrogenase family protein n=1 Tax=Bradyrhizobium sp. AUGA SZCCT0240 TaxID=2807669 RepID=UPI001BAD2E40|nr:acyl-CoA dehydrogenase family protein [Bradyrhizobium sp. AUGA SZCCT0240]MBR1252294.1 acyl-CoA dehydrogenase family protein [Bradyrhizobium sp. AUGA SZCCT0240]